MIVSYGKITFPIESLCMILSKMTPYSFAHFRYGVDIISIIISLIVSYRFNLPFYVREGTIISLLLFSGAVNFMKNQHEKLKLLA